MSLLVLKLYRLIFLRKRFYRFNRLLFQLSLRGIGVFNFESSYLSGERWLLERMYRNKLKTVLDIGANVGDFSAAVIMNNKGVLLYSFEPHPATFARLKSAAEAKSFSAINCAVGSESGEIDLYDYASADGSEHASVHKSVIEDLHRSEAVSHKVAITTIDKFVDEYDLADIDLLKIDTEGHEYEVLLGASKCLSEGRIKLIHFEFNVTNIVSRVFMKDFIDLLSDYRLFRVLPDGIIPLAAYGVSVVTEVEVFAYQNILAIHKRSQFTEASSAKE